MKKVISLVVNFCQEKNSLQVPFVNMKKAYDKTELPSMYEEI